jgi:hypothetical protein
VIREKKEVAVCLWVTRTLADEIQRAAEADEMSASSWMRVVIQRALRVRVYRNLIDPDRFDR